MNEEPSLRDANIARLDGRVFDVLVIGGGINGAVSAAALSGKGASVALIDRGDWGGFTSQESSNLAWGGIKYLESYDVRLVRKLCLSRNRLIRSFPSMVEEIRFYTGVPKGFRHGRLKLWAGAWLYWLMGNGFTRPPRLLSAATMGAEEPILDVERTVGGFEYSDAYLHDNDSRFVFTFVRSALNNGCIAANYVASQGARRDGGIWETQARDVVGGRTVQVRSRVLVNAAGPFVDAHNALTGQRTRHRHVFSKGVHLIVDRLTPNRRVLTLFASDGRLFFVIPMGARTCIGTTDTRVASPETRVSEEDRDFILANVNGKLKLAKPLTREDIIAERCGVRPLVVRGEGGGERDWLQLSRKHAVEVDPASAHVSIFGGKLTDCINVGDEVSRAVGALGRRSPVSAAPLVRRAVGRGPRRVRASGQAHGPGCADRAGLHRAPQPQAVAPLRRPRLPAAGGHPPRSAPGRDPDRGNGVHPLRAEGNGAPGNGGQARRLPPPPLEDRPRRPPRRDPPLPRAGRGLRHSLWRPGPGPPRRIFLHNRMRSGDEPSPRSLRSTEVRLA